MQLMFKYDIDRLLSFASNADNNIHIVDKDSFMMLCFPEVDYFNYAFTPTNQELSANQLSEIKLFYLNQKITKHKVIINASCYESILLMQSHSSYKHTSTISKTVITPLSNYQTKQSEGLDFIEVDGSNIDLFAKLYLDGFDSRKKIDFAIVNNFKSLLKLGDLDLFLLKTEGKYVGINVFYQSDTESLLAGGAILPKYRNKGFHQQSLKYRIDGAIQKKNAKSVVAWAYNPSISLNNMLKLKMEIQENFNVYEYCQ
jgi:hypothetical protein